MEGLVSVRIFPIFQFLISFHYFLSVSSFKCIKDELSTQFVVVCASIYYNLINDNAEINIINARVAGIENMDIYIHPCISRKSYQSHSLCGKPRQYFYFIIFSVF